MRKSSPYDNNKTPITGDLISEKYIGESPPWGKCNDECKLCLFLANKVGMLKRINGLKD